MNINSSLLTKSADNSTKAIIIKKISSLSQNRIEQYHNIQNRNKSLYTNDL